MNALMWNSVLREHKGLHINRTRLLQWNIEREEKCGFFNCEEAMCDKSIKEKIKLYEKVQTKKLGSKAAKMNNPPKQH